MASDAPMPRSRGAVSGFLLVLLGAWAGLTPFVAPYAGYGLTPDRAWAITPGRIWLSAVPGAVVLLGGLVVLLTRSRLLGVAGAIAAALGGAWLVAGVTLVRVLPAGLHASSVAPGTPIAATGARPALTGLALFGGAGALAMFFAALALGRLSLAAHRDHLRYGADTIGLTGAELGEPVTPAFDAFRPTASYSPAQAQYATDRYPPYPDQYPADYPEETFPQDPIPAEPVKDGQAPQADSA